MLWRQGDVLIATADDVPQYARRLYSPVLVQGEATGHAHRIEDPASAEIWHCITAGQQEWYLRVGESTRLIHDEHRPITLPAGIYRVWQQREYSPGANRSVMD